MLSATHEAASRSSMCRPTGRRSSSTVCAARELLEFGCPIDLHPRVFGPGRCAQTLLARANALIWHVADEPEDTWRLFVRPSFAAYVAAWLADAGDGLID